MNRRIKPISSADAYNFSGFLHWCPGCAVMHAIPLARWIDTGIEPTVAGEVVFAWRGFGRIAPAGACRYRLENGDLIFLACSHRFSGRQIELLPLPPHA